MYIVCLFVCLSVCLFVVFLSVSLFISLCVFCVCLFVCLSVCLFVVYLIVCLFVCLGLWACLPEFILFVTLLLLCISGSTKGHEMGRRKDHKGRDGEAGTTKLIADFQIYYQRLFFYCMYITGGCYIGTQDCSR